MRLKVLIVLQLALCLLCSSLLNTYGTSFTTQLKLLLILKNSHNSYRTLAGLVIIYTNFFLQSAVYTELSDSELEHVIADINAFDMTAKRLNQYKFESIKKFFVTCIRDGFEYWFSSVDEFLTHRFPKRTTLTENEYVHAIRDLCPTIPTELVKVRFQDAARHLIATNVDAIILNFRTLCCTYCYDFYL